MAWFTGVVRFIAGMAGSLLPWRHWSRLPSEVPVEPGAFFSGIATMMAGAAIGIPAFIRHAGAGADLGTNGVIQNALSGHPAGVSPAFNGLAIFTFLLLTPQGWLTLYLVGTGTYRSIAAYFDDPFGEPMLTAIDHLIWRGWARHATVKEIDARQALEGLEVSDRVISASAAGIPDCDFAIVSSRRKPGWERGVAVFTQDACYRLGEPVERTIHGRLRTLYPMKEHNDLEVVRKSVRYELPGGAVSVTTDPRT